VGLLSSAIPLPLNRRFGRPDRQYRASGNRPVLVLHTVEGRVSRSLAEGFENPPHLWYSPERRELFQTVDLRTPAYALLHPRRTPETNHRGPCLQVEIEGFARNTRTWPAAWYENIAQDVVAPLELFCRREYDQPLITGRSTTSLRFADELDGLGTLAWTGSPVRLSNPEWVVAHGLVGHQHVPYNSHWDPGHFRMSELLSHLTDPYAPRTLLLNPNGWLALRGSDVQQWQNLLVLLEVLPRSAVDGVFGPATNEATRQLQINMEMEPTGVVDANLITVARDTVTRDRVGDLDLRDPASVPASTLAPTAPPGDGAVVVRPKPNWVFREPMLITAPTVVPTVEALPTETVPATETGPATETVSAAIKSPSVVRLPVDTLPITRTPLDPSPAQTATPTPAPPLLPTATPTVTATTATPAVVATTATPTVAATTVPPNAQPVPPVTRPPLSPVTTQSPGPNSVERESWWRRLLNWMRRPFRRR